MLKLNVVVFNRARDRPLGSTIDIKCLVSDEVPREQQTLILIVE